MRKGILTIMACLGLACSPDVDGPPSTVPEIVNLEFVSQSGDDGEIFTFTIDFSDYDGNLGQGTLRASVNAEDPIVFELEALFANQTFPVPSDATLGQIQFSINYQPMSLERGATLDFEFILTDGAQQSSPPEKRTLVVRENKGG